MKRFYLLLVAAVLFAALPVNALLVDTSPTPLQEASTDVVLTYNAASPLGNGALKNLTPSIDVYAHIGVITSKSTGTSDWKYVVTPWPESGNSQTANTEKNRLKFVSPNKYTLSIGDIRTYFGIKDASETVKYIAVVFRTADGSKQGKTANGSDILIPVLEQGFQIDFTCDSQKLVISSPTKMTFTVNATAAAQLSISVNGATIASASDKTTLTAEHTFTANGTYNVEAKGTYNGQTRTQSIEVAYPGQSVQQDYPGGIPRMGAVRNDDGSVTFCMAAPRKRSVVIVPSWDDYHVYSDNLMKYQDYEGNRYFWITVEGLENDKWYPYYYIVDDTYNVADPYANLVLDCYNDQYIPSSVWPDMPQYPSDKVSGTMLAVYRHDTDSYKFSSFDIPDHSNLVIYEMLFRDFTGSDGIAAGNGTVRQAIEKIPYIKELGFNAVELMPIMEFNGNNSWGYNTNFYMAPDKAYGSPTDYKDFIEECHRNGIAVILDIVFNQSDGLHPWYQMYSISSNPFYNQTAPHEYSVLNDWNQGNPLVQQQWTDALKYWLTEYNVDGFRFDLVKGLGDNDSYTIAGGTEQYNQSRVDRMKRLHAVIKSVKPDGIHINEDLAGSKEETALGEDGQMQWANINDASSQFTMGWDDGNNDIRRFLATDDGGRPWASTISYAESHDEQRMAYKNAQWGVDAVKNESTDNYKRLGSLAVQMLLTPGPKMVWQFGELGNNQNTKKDDGDNNTDPKIVDWSAWLADNDRTYLMQTYAAAIKLRTANPELFSKEATFTASNLNAKFNLPRHMRLANGDKEIIAFINPAINGDPLAVSVPATKMNTSNARLVWASPGFTPSVTASGSNLSVSVPPHSFAIYATDNTPLSGIDEVWNERGDVTVIGSNGCISIIGEYDTATAYDISGRAMPSLEVPSGIYIVIVDGHSYKVAVR